MQAERLGVRDKDVRCSTPVGTAVSGSPHTSSTTELLEPMVGGGVGDRESAGLLRSAHGGGGGGGGGSRAAPGAAPPAAASGLTLGLSTAQYICCSLVATTLFYRELYRLQSFPQFSNQLNTTGTVVTMGLAALLLVAQPCSATEGIGGWVCSLGLDRLHFGDMAKAALGGTLFKLWMLLLLGFLNALGNMLQLMAIDGLGSRYSTL